MREVRRCAANNNKAQPGFAEATTASFGRTHNTRQRRMPLAGPAAWAIHAWQTMFSVLYGLCSTLGFRWAADGLSCLAAKLLRFGAGAFAHPARPAATEAKPIRLYQYEGEEW